MLFYYAIIFLTPTFIVEPIVLYVKEEGVDEKFKTIH